MKIQFWQASSDEIESYYQWFTSTIDERLRQFAALFASTGGQGRLDFSPKSLEPLAKWLKIEVQFRTPSREEVEKHKAAAPAWVHHTLTGPVLTDFWEERSVDVGTYLGEIFKRKFPRLQWSLSRHTRPHANFGRPVLARPSGLELPVINMAHVFLTGLPKCEDPSARLLGTFVYWKDSLLTD